MDFTGGGYKPRALCFVIGILFPDVGCLKGVRGSVVGYKLHSGCIDSQLRDGRGVEWDVMWGGSAVWGCERKWTKNVGRVVVVGI